MKLFAHLNLVRWIFAGFFGLLLCSIAPPCSAQQDIENDTTKLPFDVLNEPIDIKRIYLYLNKSFGLQKESQAPDVVETLRKQLRSVKSSSDINLDSLVNQPLAEPSDLYPHMVKSGIFLGQFYDCGKCDRTHLSGSGGVVISESGLAITNYHVFTNDVGATEGFMAMTYDGKCFEVEKILAADQVADVVLVQLKANGHKFHAAPIAKTRPVPKNDIHIVSHPSGEFFTLTSGEVSRYSAVRRRPGERGRPNSAWLEVTADFGGGSSGSGVFNAAGEVVGVVSRIHPLYRAASKAMINGKEFTKPSYVEMVIRRCTDLDSIKACFGSTESDSDLSRVEVGGSNADGAKQED